MPLLVLIWISGLFAFSDSESPVFTDPVAKEADNMVLKHFPDTAAARHFLLGRFDPAKHPDFIRLTEQDAIKDFYLQKETAAAFRKMQAAAADDGISLKIVSGGRTFQDQKNIWEWKWKEHKKAGRKDSLDIATRILEYSLMPGTSRHHWGTDIDINNINNSYFQTSRGMKVYEWLTTHAGEYGFCQVYADESGRPGCAIEKWHWSYLPLAETYLQIYNSVITYQDLDQFSGSGQADDLEVISRYVNGISTACRK